MAYLRQLAVFGRLAVDNDRRTDGRTHGRTDALKASELKYLDRYI